MARCDARGANCVGHRGRDRRDLHAGRRRRRHDAARRRHRDERRRQLAATLAPRPPSSPRRRRSTRCRRRSPARPQRRLRRSPRDDRHVDRHRPDHLHLPVAALRQRRRHCTDIAGADRRAPTRSRRRRRHDVRVVVTGTNAAATRPRDLGRQRRRRPAPPVNTVAADDLRHRQDGQTLTVPNGTWTGTAPITYTYQWQRCDAGGATARTSPARPARPTRSSTADVGKTAPRRRDRHERGRQRRAPRRPASDASPRRRRSTRSRRVSGTARDGCRRSPRRHGTWTGTPPITYTYQWQRCDSARPNCADIAGATGPPTRYAPPTSATRIRVVVTATNAGGRRPATSARAPSSPPAPPVEHRAAGDHRHGADGQTLTADDGTWTGTPPITYTYQWQRCDADGANCVGHRGRDERDATTLSRRRRRPRAARRRHRDERRRQRLRDVGPDRRGRRRAAGEHRAPGDHRHARRTARRCPRSDGTWTGTPTDHVHLPVAPLRRRRPNCSDIAGATNATLRRSWPPTSGTRCGRRHRHERRRQRLGDLGPRRASSRPPAGRLGAAADHRHAHRGRDPDLEHRHVGRHRALHLHLPVAPLRRRRHELRRHRRGDRRDVRRRLRRRRQVAARRRHGDERRGQRPATSAADGPSAPSRRSPSAPPVDQRHAEVGSTLTADAGHLDQHAPLTYTYQWVRCDAAGANCVDIPGATSSSYKADAADEGKVLKVRVTATNGGGSGNATSAGTARSPLRPARLRRRPRRRPRPRATTPAPTDRGPDRDPDNLVGTAAA